MGKQDTNTLINLWRRSNRVSLHRLIALLGIFTAMGFALSADYFAFGASSKVYLPFRFFLMGVSTLAFFATFGDLIIKNSKLFEIFIITTTTLKCLCWYGTYFYFLFETTKIYPAHTSGVLVGTTMLILFIDWYLDRLFIEVTVTRIVSLFFLIYMAVAQPGEVEKIKLVITAQLFSAFLNYRTSRTFFLQMIGNFQKLSQRMNDDVAANFVIKTQASELEMSKPREFSCFAFYCNLSSLREIAKNDRMNTSADRVEECHEAIFGLLQNKCKHSDFFIDLFEDELIAVFFGRFGSSRTDVIKELISISEHLSSVLYANLRSQVQGEFQFSFGIAGGTVETGVLGPGIRTKSSGIGRIITTAGKLEEEARQITSREHGGIQGPIVAIDYDLYGAFCDSEFYSAVPVIQRVTSVRGQSLPSYHFVCGTKQLDLRRLG